MSVVFEHPVAAAFGLSVASVLVAVAALEWEALRARRVRVRVPEFMREWSR